MKAYDVTIVGAGPGGIFTAYELSKKAPQLKVAILEYGNPLEKRKCPIDGEKITSKTLAEYLGKTKIIELHETSGAVTFEDFWSEVNTYFSGSVLDGSPFGAAEAETYAKFTWERYGDS